MALQLAGEHYSREEIELLMRLVDTDKDSLVTLPEFTSIIREDLLNNIEALFKIFDSNGDGLLSPGEVREVFDQLGEEITEEELAGWIARVQPDGRGLVSLHQLRAFRTERNNSDSSSDDEDEIRSVSCYWQARWVYILPRNPYNA